MARFRLRFAALIAAAWTAAIIDSMVTNDATLLGFVTPVMLVATTALFTIMKNGNGNGKGDENG